MYRIAPCGGLHAVEAWADCNIGTSKQRGSHKLSPAIISSHSASLLKLRGGASEVMYARQVMSPSCDSRRGLKRTVLVVVSPEVSALPAVVSPSLVITCLDESSHSTLRGYRSPSTAVTVHVSVRSWPAWKVLTL